MVNVFFSYSHKDESLRDELSNHLSILKRQGIIGEWHDRRIRPGEEWANAIDKHMEAAQIILLLISSDFLASNYCYDIEMKRAMERHESREAIVIPIILRPCRWQEGPFAKLQAFPKDAKPVTKWSNQDEAFTNIESGICAAIKQLQDKPTQSAELPESHRLDLEDESVQPVEPLKPLRLDLEQYGETIARQKVEEIKVANPYLLGDKFVGRKKELNDLTDWLGKDESRIFCICDLGGTGKSALVWHWLNNYATREALLDRNMQQYWCSFYARGFDSMQFLRDLASKLGGTTIVESDPFEAQRKLQRFVLTQLKKSPWLLVLDGLEREMGAFVNPEHYQVDSEEQDRRNEKGEVLPEEKNIRSHVFAFFLRELLRTQTKVLITSRLFPEDLIEFGDHPLPGVIRYHFVPMSQDDACEVWNLSGNQEDSPFQREFFERVGFHPQVISVVAAAVQDRSMRLNEWFSEFSEADRQACLDVSAPLTVRRHRWLDLATRDLIQNQRDAWLTICYIVRRSEASSVDSLMDSLVDTESSGEVRPGRFLSESKLRERLNYLVQRRLIGIGSSPEMVDVHPVIRGQVMNHILKQYEPGGKTDTDLLRHLESGEDSREFIVRFLNQPDLETRFQSLSSALDRFSDTPSAQSAVLNILGKFYPETQPGRRPWINALPALRFRKDQAWVLYRTGNELMTRGLWEESTIVLRRASIAYQLCGDLKSVEDCRLSHNWQSLYGGGLWQAELEQVNNLERNKGNYEEYWLALLLSIRQSEQAAELLQCLPSSTSRWTLQTVAEAWFYLEEYEKAATLAFQALNRREKDSYPVGQLLWETVTLGLALVRLGKCEEAEPYLDFAKSRGTGWAYNLVPMFALAGLIEMYYQEAMKFVPGRKRMEKLAMANLVHRQYCKSDPNDSFQIPASEAHLAMARVELAMQERDEATKLATRALKIAQGSKPPFYYSSVVKRATQFLASELDIVVPQIEKPSLETLDHEDRVRAVMQKFVGQRYSEREA